MNINDIINHLQDYWKELLSTGFVSAIIVIFWKKIEEFIKDIKLSDIFHWIINIFTFRSKTKKWRREYIEEKLELFQSYTSENEMRLYVPTRFQEERPNTDEIQEQEDKNSARKELIPYFLEKIWVKGNHDRFYCVLAETGMGKTTFLVQLLTAYINKYNEKTLPFEIFILPLADNNVIDKICKLPESSSKRKSILLLDALDENTNAYDRIDENGNIISSYEEFREALEKAVERFLYTVITCRTQFFTDERAELENLKYSEQTYITPDKSLPNYKRLYISPFSKDDIDKFIDKKFKHDRKSKQKAKDIISKIKFLAARPLILSYLDDLIDRKIENVLDAYEIIIDKWLQREVNHISDDDKRNKQKELLYEFSRKLAVYIYEKWRETGVLYLTQNEYEAFENKYEKENPDFNKLDFRYTAKSLIARDSQHNIIFAHKSFIDYFCAEQLFMGEISDFYFAEMNMAKTFFELFCQTKEEKLERSGESDVDKARRYNNIGMIYDRMGDLDKALKYFMKDLAISEKVLGDDHIDTSTSYNNIGNVYDEMGDYDMALKYHRKSLAIKEKVLGDDHIDTSASYNNIGHVFDEMGEYDEALNYLWKSLIIREKVLDNDHPDIATSYNNIGHVYDEMGEYDKALEYNIKSLEIREKVLGPVHRDTATSYNNIGHLYWMKDDNDKALEYYKKSLAIREKVLGINHISTAMLYNNIGMAYLTKGVYDKALKYLMKAKNIRELKLGKKHPSTITTYRNIGYVYEKMGNPDEAQKWFDKAGE